MTQELSRDAKKLIRPLARSLKSLLQKLVRTKTVAVPPDGNETPAQRILHSFLREHRVQSRLYETEFITRTRSPLVRTNRNYAGRKNLSARISGRGAGRSLVINGHMDTVPAGHRGWSQSPWSGAAQKGRIHGLGSFDMKGGLVAGAAVLCALSRADIRPGGDVIFESVVDEEWGGGGGTIAARMRDSADACVIPEGTQLEIYRATRGGFVVDLSVEAGDTSAYFSAGEVLSPAIPLGRLLGWIEKLGRRRAKLRPQGAYAGFPLPAPVQVLAVEANRLDPQVPLSVPLGGTVRLYMQFLPEEDVDAVIAQVRVDLEQFCAADTFFSKHPLQWRPLIGGPLYGHELAADHPWTRCMEDSAGTVLARKAVVTAAPYPCDAGLIHRDYGIPTLLFGPCGAGAHNPDEYVEWDSILRSAEVLLASALAWSNC